MVQHPSFAILELQLPRALSTSLHTQATMRPRVYCGGSEVLAHAWPAQGLATLCRAEENPQAGGQRAPGT